MRSVLFAVAVAAALSPAAPARADDWEVQRNPFDPKVIAQYKAILARAPHDANAFAKLLELYTRYSSRDNLKKEYQVVLDKKADDWASLVILGRLDHATGDDARAAELWNRAVAGRDDDTETWLALGELAKQAGKNADARPAYEKALAHATTKDLKKQALRALADLALATNDIDGANAFFKQFLDLDPQNAQLWIEYADAMLSASKGEIALEAYSKAEKLLGSDPARRVEVVSRRGQALDQMGKDDDAVAEYRRAIKLAPKGYYLEVELTGRIIDIYRRKQQLGALLAEYEKEWPEASRGHFEWDTLGKLYEETGAQDKAINALQHAVKIDPTEIETQRRLISLLENSGRDDEALAQYERVVQVAPGEARFQLELAERYWRRGNEKQALEVLVRLEQRFPNDPSVLGAIADLYTRWNKDDLAITEYERLARVEPEEPGHLVALGDQYWQKGDKAKAYATWRRMVANNKPSAWAKLGEVLFEHVSPGTQPTEALGAYDKAISLDPKNPEFYKGRATVDESMKKWAAALADWEQVLALIDSKPVNRVARREARKRLVSLLGKWSQKEVEYKLKWISAFGKTPADVEAGYFLVEYFGKHPTQQKDEPRKSLEKLVTLVPDDQDLVIDLVELYKRNGLYDEAVAKLLELAKTTPSRERDVYTRIAEIKTLERKDKEAVEWQQKALAKNPTDPSAYEHLAENYVQMQQFGNAIEAYQQVIKLDPRNSKAHFALAQLYVQNNDTAKAAELLRNLLRTASDEEIIGRAGREAIDLEEMTDTLGELEKVLSPLSFMMAHKPVYRRVLVDLYLRYVPRLVEREHHGNDEVKKAMRAELDRIGKHGLRPLLEALRDDKDANQQRSAVKVLGHLGNKGAAAPLVHLARQEPPKDQQRRIGTLSESVEREVRVEALIAAGRLGDASVLTDVMPLVDNPEKAMREAATFTLGRSGDRRAVAPLVKALADHQASVQVLACLGLAQIDDPKVGPAVVGVVADATRSDVARAACAYAIGARHYAAGTPALLTALDDNRGDAQRLAAWGLGQLADGKALGPLIRAYFSRAGQSADELVWAIGRTSNGSVAAAALADLGDYPLRAGKYDEHGAIADLPGAPPAVTPSGRLAVDHASDIAAGLVEALGEHRDVVVSVLSDLDAAPAAISLGALTPNAASDPKLAGALAQIAKAIAPAVTAQLASDDPKVRALALSVCAKMSDGEHDADAAIVKAFDDPADQVRVAAMDAVAVVAARRGHASPQLVATLAGQLSSPRWADRRAAAFALGRLGPSADVGALAKAANDAWSFVREAVAVALGQTGSAAARAPLEQLARDSVPQVRDAAVAALAKIPH
jgi:tetratricopeptide (TPR) repeat protein